jgi:mono/diheme cytochrome c family protein
MRRSSRVPPALLALWCAYALAAALGFRAAFREPKRIQVERIAPPSAPPAQRGEAARADVERAAASRWAALAPAPELREEFLPPDTPPFSAREVALGARLFTSAWTPGARSCASCHDPHWGFGGGGASGAPPLLDLLARQAFRGPAGWQALEARIESAIRDERELGARTDDAERALKDCAAALGAAGDQGGSPGVEASVGAARAIAAFLALQRSGPSPFDRERAGTPALSALQRRGRELFEGAAGCATCHLAPRFDVLGGGTLRDLELRPPFGAARHGTLRQLLAAHAPPTTRSPEALAALEAFLRALGGERAFPYLPERAPATPESR